MQVLVAKDIVCTDLAACQQRETKENQKVVAALRSASVETAGTLQAFTATGRKWSVYWGRRLRETRSLVETKTKSLRSSETAAYPISHKYKDVWH